MWWFPKIEVPPVIIHLIFGCSMKLTIQLLGVPNYGNPHVCSLMFQGPTFNLPEGISHIGRPFLDDSLLPSHM